jgi:ribulose-phosphate 3-epimerase
MTNEGNILLKTKSRLYKRSQTNPTKSAPARRPGKQCLPSIDAPTSHLTCLAARTGIVSKPYFRRKNYGSLRFASHGGKRRCEPESMAWIAPSLLGADFTKLAEVLEIIKAAGGSLVHVDVMDGHFTPDITVGQPVIASLRKATDLVLDVHLLIERPERYVAGFVEAGADRLSVQAEATVHLHRVVELIRRCGAKAGLALDPATPLAVLDEVLPDLDFVTILAADPTLKGQRFLPGSVAKVRAAARTRQERGLSFGLQVEGGVGEENLAELVRAGADILVVGSAIFTHKGPAKHLAGMMRTAAEAEGITRA